MANTDHVFHRHIDRDYPVIIRGEGIYLFDTAGRRYIDGTSGVFASIVGQNVDDITDAIIAQMRQFTFANTNAFTSEAEQGLAERLVDLAPDGFGRVWICTSGSTANDMAIKLARHYHLLRGNAEKFRAVARWHSYHGSTLGALSMTGSVSRRKIYEPLLLDFPLVEPPYCYRCPLSLSYPSCETACVEDLETTIRREGAQHLSAFIVEPIAGGTLGMLVTPPEYLRRAREICDQHDMLLIVDEVVSGMGRTGQMFAFEASGVVPDIITMAKGLGAGHVPIGAVVVHERVYEAFEAAGISFSHAETFSGHSTVCAAGVATLDYLKKHDLVRRAGELGVYFGERLEAFRDLPLVGDVRGAGILRGLELVADKATRKPFAREKKVAEAVVAVCLERGLFVHPGGGMADGVDGDAVCLGPPHIITREQIDDMLEILESAICDIATRL